MLTEAEAEFFVIEKKGRRSGTYPCVANDMKMIFVLRHYKLHRFALPSLDAAELDV